MNRRKRSTRGVTLAELCIVMAVIAIVSTMVVSFTVLMQARTRVIAADRDTVSDLGTVESVLDRFIRAYDSDEYTLSLYDRITTTDWEHPASSQTVDKYTSIAVLKDENVTAKLKLSIDPETEKVNAIVITDGSDNVTVTYPLYSVTRVSFVIESNDTSALVICTVEYTSTHGNEQVTKKATLCHAVRAMKFVAPPIEDIKEISSAIGTFMQDYKSNEYKLKIQRELDKPVSMNLRDTLVKADINNIERWIYRLTPIINDGKITELKIEQHKEDNAYATIKTYSLNNNNITMIEYTAEYDSDDEETRQIISLICTVTYTDETGTRKGATSFHAWHLTVSERPAEGGIEP